MKNKSSIVIIVIIILLIIFGYVTLSSPKQQSIQMHDHMHSELEVDNTKPIPSVSIEAIPDIMDGYNIHITTTNFKITPENVNKEPTPNEGHIHIYLNDVKYSRVYGNWIHIPNSALMSSETEIMVTLNADDHSDWILNGSHISDAVIVKK